jgi:hypothetical protein
MIANRSLATRREALDTIGEQNRAVVAEWSPEAVGAQMREIIRRALTREERGMDEDFGNYTMS